MTALRDSELRLVDAYWRAANYLSVAQIYLLDNPLLREPLKPEHVKPRLLGHFGTVPGLNMLYAHLNRQIRARDLNAIYVTGPATVGRPRRQRLSRRHLQRALSERIARPGRAEAALPSVLLPRRDPQPRGSRGARLDPRRRRARLRARARLRRRVRQPRPARRAASSATARRRQARSRRAGTRTSCSTRRPTARCFRSST